MVKSMQTQAQNMVTRQTARRTQEERSSTTRDLILGATIECLIEEGYSATTTTAIQARADVSRGAITHHFPSKSELMVAAIRHLVDARMTAMREAADSLSAAEVEDPIEAGIRLIWSETFENGALYGAAVELWTAARTDEELHSSLLSVEREVAAHLKAHCVSVVGDKIANTPGFEAAFRAALFFLRGAALTNIVRVRGSDTTRYLTEAITVFRARLDRGAD